MSTNDSNFDFEKYQSEHEGVVPKAGSLIKKRLLKVLKFAETPVIINLLALLAAGVQVYKACTTLDAGLILEKRATELQQNAIETMQFLYSVTLPDSIERLKEVQDIRSLQRRMYAFELKYVSLMSMPGINDTDEAQTNLDLYIDYLAQYGGMMKDWGAILDSVKSKNPSFNPFLLTKCDHILNIALKNNSETTSKLRSLANSNKGHEQKVKGAIKIMKEQFLSKQYVEYNKVMHELNVASITWSNTRLLMMAQ